MGRIVITSTMFATLLLSGTALAQTADLLPGMARQGGQPAPAGQVPPDASSGTWTSLANPFPGKLPDTALLLTDGAVIMHDGCTPNWYRLTPDNTGNYVKGAWAPAAALPSGYGPFYFASQVLADGRVMISGGEYNLKCVTTADAVWTNKGALFDPVANTWTDVPPPSGWTTIGDSPSAVRQDGSYMVANAKSKDLAIASIAGTAVTWTVKASTGTHKRDVYGEEAWTHLPDHTLLTVDANRALTGTVSKTEVFRQKSNTWASGHDTSAQMVEKKGHDIGPAVLLPSGLVYQFGGTGNTSIYDPVAKTWTAGPAMPDGNVSQEGPAAVLPSGNILVQLSPTGFKTPSMFYEVAVTSTTATFTRVTDPPGVAKISSYEGRMLMLPTGEVLWSSDLGTLSIYTPQGAPDVAWKPVIAQMATKLKVGATNVVLRGKLLHGLSEGGYYGDDAQMSTNYPLVRITNTGSHHVCFARTHDHSVMGVADTTGSRTEFDIPAACETGASTLAVVVNGIASDEKPVTLN